MLAKADYLITGSANECHKSTPQSHWAESAITRKRLGVLIAFLVTHDLLNPGLVQANPSAVGRIKMQDLAGAAFLTTVLGGELQVRASF